MVMEAEGLMSELADVFRGAVADYGRLKQECEARVVRWQWATFSIYHPKPFYYERERIPRGRKLAGRPENLKSGTHEYGIDEAGRIVVVREYGGIDGPKYEEFFAFGDGMVEGVRFDWRRPNNAAPVVQTVNVTRQRLDRGRIVSLDTFAMFGRSAEVYEYGDGGERITRVRGSYESREDEGRGHHYVDELGYDPAGRLSRVRREYPPQKEYPSGAERVIYLRPQKGPSVRELAKAIEEKLVRLVPETLRCAGISEAVYCVLLAYNSQSPELSPRMGVGLERQRRVWVAEHGKGAKHYVWNLPEFEWSGEEAELDLTGDAELSAACGLFNQQLALKGTCGPARTVLNEVARRLNDFDWTGSLDVTDDFVVLAYDDEEIDFGRNWKAGVPAGRLALLKARGWL